MSEPRRITNIIERVSTWAMGPKMTPVTKLEVARGPGLLKSRAPAPASKEAFNDGSMTTNRSGVTVTEVKSLASYYNWYGNDGVVFAGVNTLAEASVGQGYHTKINEDEPEKAKELVDELGKELNLDLQNPNVCKNMLIAGFCPVWTGITKFPKKSATKIIHPMTVHSFAQDKTGKLLWLKQVNESGSAGKKIKADDLTWFVNNMIGNDLRGTSIIKPVQSLLSTKETAISNMDAIIERKLYPVIIWKTTRSVGGLKENVLGVEAGEDLFFGNLMEAEVAPGNLFEIVEVRGDSKFWDYIAYIDQLIYRGLYAPDLYYWKDATVASAQELTAMTDRNINAIQRNMGRGIEKGYFDRLMTLNGLKAEPNVVWGIEKTGAEDLQMENIIATAIEVGMIGPDHLSRLLKMMGLNIGELGWDLEDEPEEEEDQELPPDDDEDGEEEEDET